MSETVYRKIKRNNGEQFAQALRNFHNGILDIPDIDILLRHAGREAEPLLPYIMSLMASNDDKAPDASADPFVLLDRAGYEAFYADTLDKQNSIRGYFEPNEMLCTFNDHARFRKYHIVHAVRKDAGNISRDAFRGREDRQDAYGTSVISIQMMKKGGFISIKNRYNHAVASCDDTFNSNPDNIVRGLSAALKARFNVEFSVRQCRMPTGYVLMGKHILKYHTEFNNIYYGDQVWGRDGLVHSVNRSAGHALFDEFVFDNKSKTLKAIDPHNKDSFVDDFNRCYGGNRRLSVQNGNLTLEGTILIGAEESRIKTLYLPELTTMGYNCLDKAYALTSFIAPALVTMGDNCLERSRLLECFEAPALTAMANGCLTRAHALTRFEVPSLTTMGSYCLYYVGSLQSFIAPSLTSMGWYSIHEAPSLRRFESPSLTAMGGSCLHTVDATMSFDAPMLKDSLWCPNNIRELAERGIAGNKHIDAAIGDARGRGAFSLE